MDSKLQLHVFLTILSLRVVSACFNDECRDLAFPSFFFFANKRLVNHNITTVKVRDMDACELRCYHEPNCVSINFNKTASAKGTYRCDLNNATHRGHDEEFVDTDGYLYRGADSACDRAHCNNGGTCQSGFTDKGYRCLCPPGFMSAHCKQDVNECASGKHNCSQFAVCNNTQGSFNCTCKQGYTGDGYNCSDIDECVTGTHNCSNDTVCNNTKGGLNCTCKTGFIGDGHNCTDINECLTGAHNCSSDATCNNTKGAFYCTCRPGFTGDGQNCTDIDECVTGTHNCSNDTLCNNTKGGFNCTCKAVFAGDGTGQNDKVYKSCSELYKAGKRTNGVYKINPDNGGAFDVYCDQTTDGGGWTVFQKRLDGSVDFYRGWDCYTRGFGNLNGEFWLGLDKIHRLTKKPNKLRVDLEDFSNNTRYAEYNSFGVGDEGSKYKLTLSSYSGTAGDSLSVHRGMAFSTKDRDNDIYFRNCAAQFKGAWWYNKCHESNLNGRYLRGKHSSYADGVNWYHWKGHYYSLKRAEMKIKPVNA